MRKFGHQQKAPFLNPRTGATNGRKYATPPTSQRPFGSPSDHNFSNINQSKKRHSKILGRTATKGKPNRRNHTSRGENFGNLSCPYRNPAMLG